MGYFDGNTVTALWNYAQHFAMSDNSYGTTFGSTLPGISIWYRDRPTVLFLLRPTRRLVLERHTYRQCAADRRRLLRQRQLRPFKCPE